GADGGNGLLAGFGRSGSRYSRNRSSTAIAVQLPVITLLHARAIDRPASWPAVSLAFAAGEGSRYLGAGKMHARLDARLARMTHLARSVSDLTPGSSRSHPEKADSTP